MNWHEAMWLGQIWARRHGARFRVTGRRFHDPAGLVPDGWVYVVELIR